MKSVLIAIVVLLAISVTGCGILPGTSQSPVQVESSWVRAATSGNKTAAFMVLKNTASTPDKLIKAEASISDKVVLMDTQKKNGKMEMVNVDSIAVPANGQVELKSGSFHVMFMGLNKDLAEGDKVQLTLTFENAGVVQIDAPIQKTPDTQ